jgi:UDP-N-acetylmuramoyl-tripeptide--D-alanyl-D-alanine ligase
MIFKQRKLIHKLCIVGSMKELGQDSINQHQKILELLFNLDFFKTVLIGEEFYKHKRSFRNFKFYKTTQDYIKYMRKDFLKSKNIFVMGSRYYKLEAIINNVK